VATHPIPNLIPNPHLLAFYKKTKSGQPVED